jgi:hypothetical protein
MDYRENFGVLSTNGKLKAVNPTNSNTAENQE